MKRICIAANSDLRFDQRLQRISSALLAAGFGIEMLGRQFEGNEAMDSKTGSHHLRLWFQKGKLAYLELNVRLLLALMFRRMDAICSVDLDTLPACWLAARLKNCMLVQDSHEYMAEVPEVTFRPLTKKMWHWVARTFLPACDLRYTVSQGLVEEFRLRYGLHFDLIRNITLLQPEEGDFSLPAGCPQNDYLVFLGAVNRGRGLEELLEVLAERQELLVIVGEGDFSAIIREQVVRLGLEGRVFFCGKVLPEQARVILRNARAGINLLSGEGLSYRYSLANKFFDYVHACIPQICIDFPEYKKLMQVFSVGINCPLEKERIHEALNMLASEIVRKEFIEETKKARLEWNWQHESKRLVALYQDLFAR